MKYTSDQAEIFAGFTKRIYITLKVAQAQLGHLRMATSLKIDTHASVSAQRDAVILLEDQMFPHVPKFAESGTTAQEKPQLLP